MQKTSKEHTACMCFCNACVKGVGQSCNGCFIFENPELVPEAAENASRAVGPDWRLMWAKADKERANLHASTIAKGERIQQITNVLSEVLHDLESDYIAQHSHRADVNRRKLEDKVRAVLKGGD